LIRVERLLLVVDEGDGVNEGEIKPRLEVWVSLFGLEERETEGKGNRRSARLSCASFLVLKPLGPHIEIKRKDILTTSVRTWPNPQDL